MYFTVLDTVMQQCLVISNKKFGVFGENNFTVSQYVTKTKNLNEKL